MTSFAEIEFSPYYKYLNLGNRTLSLNLKSECFSEYTNEFSYIENCVDSGWYIDLPIMSGAVHIEHCISDVTCQVPYSSAYSTAHFEAGGTQEALNKITADFSLKH